MKKGPLVKVKHPDGHYSKMYQADAEAAGLAPGHKALPAGENKMLTPAGNKSLTRDAAAPAPEDFTTIEGLGPAAARSLVAQGITTFAQLRAARNLSLPKKTLAAIETWRAAEAGGPSFVPPGASDPHPELGTNDSKSGGRGG